MAIKNAHSLQSTVYSRSPKSEDGKQSIMDQLMASYDNRRLSFGRGEKITGEVISITEQEIILDLRAKAEGVLSRKDLSAVELSNLKIGDSMDVFVTFPENESGQVVLSCFRPENIPSRSSGGRKIDLSKWQKFIQGYSTKAIFTGEITEINRGGLIVAIDGIRGFIPSSQISLKSISNQSNLSDIVGKELKLTVMEVDPGNNKLVFSARPNLSEEDRKELSKLKVGEESKGKIIAVTPFGLFVNVNETEGIIYPQETTWDAPEANTEIDLTKNYKAGQEIEAKITGVDENLGRLNLSIRQMVSDPFESLAEKFQADDVITGVVTNITQNGIDVALEGVLGFLPVEKMEGQTFQMGQKTNFLVDSVDTKNRRINLAPFLTSTVGLIYK